MPGNKWRPYFKTGSTILKNEKTHRNAVINATDPLSLECASTDNVQTPYTMVQLSNQICIHFHSPTGCKRGDWCKYLHSERPFPCILYNDDTNLIPTQYRYVYNTTKDTCLPCQSNPDTTDRFDGPAAPEMEVPRIFFTGIPHGMSEGWLHEVVSAVGTVVEVTYNTHNPASAFKSGHIVMSSSLEAQKAIDRICAIRFGEARVKAFVDNKNPTKKLTPCVYFAKGKCIFGNQCHYLHVLPPKPSSPIKSGYLMHDSSVCSPSTAVVKLPRTIVDNDGFAFRPNQRRRALTDTQEKAFGALIDKFDEKFTPRQDAVVEAPLKTDPIEAFEPVYKATSRTGSKTTIENDGGGDCALFAISQRLNGTIESCRAHSGQLRQKIVQHAASNRRLITQSGLPLCKFVLDATTHSTFEDYLLAVEADGYFVGTTEFEILADAEKMHIRVYDTKDMSNPISVHGDSSSTKIVDLVFYADKEHYELLNDA